MDTLSHGLWGGVVFGRRRFWLAFLLGMAPDLLSFGPFFLQWALAGFPAYPKEPGLDAPALASLPPFVFTAYNLTHSLVLWVAIFMALWFVWKKPPLAYAAWGLHIFFDIPLHTSRYFPTPFLWPFHTPFVNGMPWSRPWLLILNYAILVVALFFIYRHRRRHPFHRRESN